MEAEKVEIARKVELERREMEEKLARRKEKKNALKKEREQLESKISTMLDMFSKQMDVQAVASGLASPTSGMQTPARQISQAMTPASATAAAAAQATPLDAQSAAGTGPQATPAQIDPLAAAAGASVAQTPAAAQVAAGFAPTLPPASGPAEEDPPTQEEIEEYAEYLGMDVAADRDLLYIAEWAITAPLPDGWTEHLDAQGNEFYYNSMTSVSTYEHPLDEQYRSYYRQVKAQKMNDERRAELARRINAA